ncbi:MAG: nucleotidyltransferase domain-containing protein [Desulfobacula sp.]
MNVQSKIKKALDRIETEETVKILYACESGSRAWGFESQDSDYDVRFIYVRPTAWYLTIQHKRDVIEKPIDDELDLSGWNLPKALELYRKGNPPLLEWLQSPIIYRESGSMAKRLRELLTDYYSPVAAMYHYLHMARGNYRQYLQGDRVWIKKYFYVLRPLLACIWIEKNWGLVPTEFEILFDRIVTASPLRKSIQDLLSDKKRGEELRVGPSIPAISDFINSQLERLSTKDSQPSMTKNPDILDKLFVEVLIETYGQNITESYPL